jgi:hypothetical protein
LLLAVGAKNSSYTTVCSGDRRGELVKLNFFFCFVLFILFHVLTHLEDKLDKFCVTFVFNSAIAFPVMQVVKTNHQPCFEPLFSPLFILNTFLRHRL